MLELLTLLSLTLLGTYVQSFPQFQHTATGDTAPTILPNNSFINRDAIGTGETAPTALMCVTDNVDCCTNPDEGGWTDEQGMAVPQSASAGLYVTRGNRVVSLNRNMGGSSGMWRCDIPDFSGVMQSLYIYLGDSNTGQLTSASISFTTFHTQLDVTPPEFSVTCLSEGGPATTVLWWRETVPWEHRIDIVEDRDHETSQIIADTSSNTVYENRLRVRGREEGNYWCTVSSNRNEFFNSTGNTITGHLFNVQVSPVVIKTTPHLVSTTPYKRFTVTCTARAVIEGQTIPLEMTLNWRRRRLSDNVRFTRVPSTEYVTTGSSENGYQSVLNTYELDTENRISYRCRATPVSDSRLQGTIDTVVNVYAAAPPTVVVKISPSSVHILNVPPYNQFTVTCVASAEVYQEAFPLEMTVKWTVDLSGTTSDVSFTEYVTTGSPEDGYRSILNITGTDTVNTIQYHCTAQFIADSGVQGDSHTTVEVKGPTNPTHPEKVRVIDVCNDRATIQWTALSIGYTPETYVVQYGTSQDSLNLTSDSQHSGPDITVTNITYSVHIFNLEPATTYHYRVVATNTANKSTVSGVHNFLTSDSPLRINTSGDYMFGHHYTLTCILHTSGRKLLSNLQWRNSTGHALNTSTVAHETALELHFQPLRISDGGRYTCVAEYNGLESKQSVDVLGTVPPPTVTATTLGSPDLLYAGLNLTLQCDVTLHAVTDTHVEVSVEWRKNEQSFSNCLDTERLSSLKHRCSIKFTPLSYRTDSGVYYCVVVLMPRDAQLRNLGTLRGLSNSLRIHILVPIVSITMTTTTNRVLNVPPYNTFNATCSARVEVSGLEGRVELRRKWQWKRRGTSDSKFLLLSDMFHTDIGDVSVLSMRETYSDSVGYRCRCDLKGFDNIHDTEQLHISVHGPTSPSPPTSVTVLGISHNRATIQWTVPSIAYTPETYVVEYGTSQDTLNLTSVPQHSGPDITVTDMTYSMQVSNLEPATTYHYQVAATNTAGLSTTSGVQSFMTENSSLNIQHSGDLTIGNHYTLTCTTYISSGEELQSLEWRNSIGHSLNASTGGHVTSLELHFQPLSVSDGGQYTCVAEYTSGIIRTTSDVVLVSVPSPTVTATALGAPDVLYAGLNLTLQCNVTLLAVTDTHVEVFFEWRRNEQSFRSCLETRRLSPTKFQCTTKYTPLSYSGMYTCTVFLSPRAQYTYLRNQTEHAAPLWIAIPQVSVSITTANTQLLDVSPYNTFTATCSATVEVNGLEERMQLRRRWQWKRRGVDSGVFHPVSDIFHTDSGSVSILNVSEVTAGSVAYQCLCDLEGISDTAQVIVSIIGPRAPNSPQNVALITISDSRATIQWTVPSIAYTPESYVVEYGTSQDSLNLTSVSQHSGPDITVTDVTYSVQLANMEPATTYHYQVVAVNMVDTTASGGMQSFKTGDSSLQIQLSGGTMVGHHHTVTCTIHVPCDQQLSHLQWRNSTGHTLNTSTGGYMITLELNFQPLRVTDGGQYTCVAEYDGVYGRQTSEVVLFTDSGPVSYVIVKSLDSSSLDISWGSPMANEKISHYLVWINSSSQRHMASVPAPAQSMLVSQLESGVPYRVYVAAVNSAGDMEWRETDFMFTEELTPRAPHNLSASVMGRTHAMVEWTLLSPDEARGHVVSYTVTYSNAMDTNIITTYSSQNSAVINDLTAGTYSIHVWATTAGGEGEKSSTVLHISDTINIFVIVGGAVVVALAIGVAIVVIVLLVLKIRGKNSSISNHETIGVAKDDSAMSTSRNLAYGVVSHDTREKDQYEYELVALNQSQLERTPRAVLNQKKTCSHAIPQMRTGTKEPTYEVIAGN